MLVGCWNVFHFMPLISEHIRETTRIILVYFINPLLFWGVHTFLKLVIGQHSYFNVVLKVPDEVGGFLQPQRIQLSVGINHRMVCIQYASYFVYAVYISYTPVRIQFI